MYNERENAHKLTKKKYTWFIVFEMALFIETLEQILNVLTVSYVINSVELRT